MYEIDIKLKCANDVQFIRALQSLIADAFTFKDQINGDEASGITLEMDKKGQGNNLYAYSVTIPDLTQSKYD